MPCESAENYAWNECVPTCVSEDEVQCHVNQLRSIHRINVDITYVGEDEVRCRINQLRSMHRINVDITYVGEDEVRCCVNRLRSIIIIIYRDFLPPPRSGSLVKSDNTHAHTIINKHPFAHVLDICSLIFSSCAFLKV